MQICRFFFLPLEIIQFEMHPLQKNNFVNQNYLIIFAPLFENFWSE